jgi:3,4-dihydroxy 2-butanone 4-phosphate synthase/GTP cyclohydrolase II
VSSTTAVFAGVLEAVEEIRAGRMVIVVDDQDRENEGDLVMAAERATPEAVNFMARFGRGLICVPVEGERLDELQIPQMVPKPGDHMGTAFTVSVDARTCTTGISAHERAATIRVFVDPAARPEDLVRPGHIFPLRSKEGGVLRRPGHTEAAVDLARLAGLAPAGVICEIMADDGQMMRLPGLQAFAAEHGLKILTIADLVEYRRRTEKLIRRVADTLLPTRYGEWRLFAYDDQITGETHVALTLGPVDDGRPVLVRMHSECLTGDVFGSLRCDCGSQLDQAMRQIAAEGRGVLVYLRQEGRGIGLANKLRAYALQDQGLDTVEANLALGLPVDARDYGTGSQILADLGVRQIRLLTNNPKKYSALSGFGLEIVERVPVRVEANTYSARYLATKKTKLGHLFD